MNWGFDSIAGYDEEKNELKLLCDVLNHRKEHLQRGAKLPKGIIFYGETGNGKTLFVKVLAKECGLKVFEIDLGATESESQVCKAIKQAFNKAKKCKDASMVLFDEMDKVLPNELTYVTDRATSVLAQLLTLIDGINSGGNVIFVATCNDYFDLPETLTRAGRLDKKFFIGKPTYASRVQILQFYIDKTNSSFELSVAKIAKLCSGFSSAELETLVNECILHSRGNVSERLILQKISEIKNDDIVRENRSNENIVWATRNVGCFAVARKFNNGPYVLSLDDSTVCNRYFDSLISDCDDDYDDSDGEWDDDYGFAEDDDGRDSDEERTSQSEYYSMQDFIDAITVLLGGYCAQKMLLGKTFDNIADDFESVNALLFCMADNGMFGSDLHYNLDRARTMPYSDGRIDKLNELFDKTIADCMCRAEEILKQNRELVSQLASVLVNKQRMEESDCEPILQSFGGLK